MKKKRELSIGLALFGFFAPLVVLLALIFSGVSIMLGLTAAICVEGLFGVWLGHSWEELEESAMKGIGRVNQTVIVMILIGMLIGVWISAGSVQTMLYYGINLITPKLFLPVAFIICVITSLVTGTSWGTAGTMGIALIGVALGIAATLIVAANSTTIPAQMNVTAILVSFGFSAATGIFFGYYPAYKASKLTPIDALRYE